MSRVVTAAWEWKSAGERVQSAPLPGLPAGAPGADHAPRPVSKPSASVVAPVTSVELVEVEDVDETARAASGFGSTGLVRN